MKSAARRRREGGEKMGVSIKEILLKQLQLLQ